ncbi:MULTISPECIES: PGF-pre-PGF domain-containing protein [Haloarcula]|uniref:PGF-pre-PGF domain-containing protein n=1 Tax=Haloarcula TaxID=2237 RepID=UPI0023EB6344|nr:PGF-pre-PGF domain-containing protein [Halomicroarcula sp. XH51]
MKRHDWSPAGVGTRLLALALVVAMVTGAVAGPAAAEPRLFIPGGSLEAKETLVGDDLNVTVRVKNTGGDGGGLTVNIRRNGTTVTSERVVVESDSEIRITKAIQFDQPGKYVIKANDRKLGEVTARRATSRVTSETNGSRTVEIRTGGIPTTDPYDIDMPAAENRSFAIERWTVEASEDRFTQRVTEYTSPSASSVTLPDDEGTSVLGVVTVGSSGGVDAVRMRIEVNRTALRDAGIETDALALYAQNGSTWTELETSVVDERTDAVVYEARATSFDALALGTIQPVFDVGETNLRTVQTADGRRIVVETAVTNSGSVAGDYEATITVNGESANASVTRIPAGQQRTLTLATDVTSAGEYRVALNDRSVGSVVITEAQVGDEPTEQPGTETGTASQPGGDGDGDGDADGDGLPAGLPATVFGIDTALVAGGVAVALLVFFGALAVLRRGSGDGPGGSDFEL